MIRGGRVMTGDEMGTATLAVEGVTDQNYTNYEDLRGQHVFISGGGSGIGAYFVDAFAAQGARVSFISLDANAAHRLCDAVERSRALRPQFTACDVRDLPALESVVLRSMDQNGPVRVLVNNAARDERHTLDGLSPHGWDDSINTNLRPYFFTAQAAASAMRAGGGSIINLGSNAANLGLAGYPAYVTAKAAIVGLTKALARELGPHGIRVNALIPGWVMTQRQQALWAEPQAVAECLAQQSLKRTLHGADIAQAALFLASEASSMMTGQSLIVDGGRAMP